MHSLTFAANMQEPLSRTTMAPATSAAFVSGEHPSRGSPSTNNPAMHVRYYLPTLLL